MKETLIILPEPIFKFNKQFFDDFDVDFHIYTLGDDSFYDLKSEYKNIIFILDDLRFDCVVKTNNPYDTSKHDERSLTENKSIYYDNWQIFSDKLPTHTKFLLFDFNHEAIQAPIESWTKQWLELSDRNYCISQRLSSLVHERCLNTVSYTHLTLPPILLL